MSREDYYVKMLEAAASMQFNISVILEAKAAEAEKSRNWICQHVLSSAFFDHEEQLKHSIGVHEQLVALIAGLTQLENGLAKNLKVILGHEEQPASGGFGNFFGQTDEET